MLRCFRDAKKWSERLKLIGEQAPSEDLMDKLNNVEKLKKIAKPNNIKIQQDIANY